MAAPGFVEVEVPGHGVVELPEGMSREDMAAAIHQLPPPKGQQTAGDQALGMAKQAGVGAANTVINNAGLPGDLREAAGSAADWVASKFRKPEPKTLTQYEVEKAGGSPAAPFDERFTGKPAATAGDIVKGGLRHMPGLAGAMFSVPTSGDIKQGVEGVTGEFRKPQNVGEEYANTVGEFLPAMAVGPGAVAGNTVKQTMVNLLKQIPYRFTTNAALPGVTSEAAGQAVRKVAPQAEPYVRFAASMAPAAVMSAGQAAWRGVRKPNIPPERQAAADRLAAQGIDEVSPGEITGDLNRRYKETTAGLRAQEKEEAKLRQLTAAAVRTYGETGDNFHEALAAGHARIGPGIEDSAGRISIISNPVAPKVNSGMMARLTSDLDKRMVAEGIAPGSPEYNRVDALRSQVIGAFNLEPHPTNPSHPGRMVLEGPAFQRLIAKESPLSRAASRNDDVGYYAREIKKELMESADRSANRSGTREGTGSRQAFDEYRIFRRQYANMKAMEEGASAAGENAAKGLLTPAALRQIATNRDKADYFLGRGDYGQLAKDANLLMTALPNSGTAQRLKASWPTNLIGSLIGAGLGSPLPAVGPAVGAAVGGAVAPSIMGRMVRLKPWWLDQEIANRRHLASLLQSEVAGRKLLEGPDQSR